MGRYGVHVGDECDTSEYIPINELQTDNRGKLRAALYALQGRVRGTQILVCPDSTYVVGSVPRNGGATSGRHSPA